MRNISLYYYTTMEWSPEYIITNSKRKKKKPQDVEKCV